MQPRHAVAAASGSGSADSRSPVSAGRSRITSQRAAGSPADAPTGPQGDAHVVGRVVWTPEKVRALGLTTDLTTAAHILGMGRTTAFELLRTGEFPVPVHRYGRRLVVPVLEILRLLGVPGPGGDEASLAGESA